jgi:hypothetical protein
MNVLVQQGKVERCSIMWRGSTNHVTRSVAEICCICLRSSLPLFGNRVLPRKAVLFHKVACNVIHNTTYCQCWWSFANCLAVPQAHSCGDFADGEAHSPQNVISVPQAQSCVYAGLLTMHNTDLGRSWISPAPHISHHPLCGVGSAMNR